MRFLHLADLHIGKVVHGFSLLEDQRFVFEQLLDLAVREGCNAVVLAGDVYDKSQPSAEAVRVLDEFLSGAVARGLRVIATPGNHDSAERVAYGAGLLGAQGVHVAPLFTGAPSKVEFEDEHGTVAFWLFPFVRPADVRPHFPDAEIGTSYTAAVRALADACDIVPGTRNVAVAHQFITAGAAEPERSDSELNLGTVDNVDASVFDAFDYVALGHVHKPQRIGRDEVRYAGSPLAYSFSEVRWPKKATIVTMGAKGEVAIDLLPIHPLHEMREVRGPIDALLAPEAVAQGAPDDYLHVILTDAEEAIDAISRVRAVFSNLMQLEYDNARTAAAAADGPGADDLSKIDPFQLFSQFFAQQTGHDLEGAQAEIAEADLRRSLEKGGAR